ncbi:MAG: GtrA family protein [Proteobacteria bacterium]|nr:GtrA family protein [Pseudomonadota bacterium]
MHALKIEFSKFTVVGAVNFVFTFVLFYLLVKVLQTNYLIALVAVSLLGMILTYLLNYKWVFKPEKELAFKGRLPKYIFAGCLSIALNSVALGYIVERTAFDPFYVQTALIPFIVIFNFSTAKFWSLRRSGDWKRNELSL